MTSTPTLCQVCGREQFIDKPRQPDSTEPRVVTELQQLIDTPTVERTNAQIVAVCKKAQLAIAMLMQGHARALKEMGAKLESAEEGERFYRREWESACERVDYAQEQLAAAELKAGEYEKCLALIAYSGVHDLCSQTAQVALAAHNRPTKEAADE